MRSNGMEMPRPTDDDRRRFTELVPDDDRVQVKPMFGNLGAFVNGNMFMGLFGSDVGIKLERADAADLLSQPGAGPFGPAERPMGGYVTLPAGWTEQEAEPWIAKSLDHGATLPAKKPKQTKK